MQDDNIELEFIPTQGIKIQPYATLRDYMAMAALTGLLSNPQAHSYTGVNNQAYRISENAYEIADAMLKAREAK